MGNFKHIKCDNDKCDFWQDGNCLYGGTAEIVPNPLTNEQCKAYEPYRKEEE